MSIEKITTNDISAALGARGARAEEGDYIGEDGLLYCGKCHTVREVRYTVFGKEKVFPAACKCRDEARKAEEARKKALDEARRIRRHRDACFHAAPQLEDCTFACDDGEHPALSKKIQRYAAQWEAVKREEMGLLFYGEVGAGKTFYAACIANALLDQGVRVLMTSFSRIVNTMQGMYEGKQAYLDRIVETPLLIIDDLGAERASDYMLEQVFNIVDARYQSGLPLIVTTNVDIEELKKPADLKYKRIYDRILQMCFPIEVTGRSKRRKILHDDYARRARLLE